MLIRNRLTLIFTLLATGIQLVLSLLAWFLSVSYREEEFFERLHDTALVSGRLLIARRHLHDDFFKNMIKSDLLTIVDEQITILDDEKSLVFSNRNLKDVSFYREKMELVSPKAVYHFKQGRLEGIGITFTDRGQTFYIFCAGYDSLGNAQLDNLWHILALVNLIGFSMIVLAGWYFSNRALAPITTIISEVESINYRHLNKRVNEGNRTDEIAQLAITFNSMLLRLEEAFQNQKSFVSHASHELRTPLTNLLGTLETSLTYDNDEVELKKSMQLAMDELKKLIALTNGLLSLAKVSDSIPVLETIQADDCLLMAVSQIKSKYPQRKIKLHFPESYDSEFLIQGSAPLLTTALANVIDNACKYSAEEVSVSLLNKAGTIEIVVADTGRGIEDAEREKVFEALYRGSNSNDSPGFGIGLSITQKVVELHGGALSLDSKLGRGTTVVLRFSKNESGQNQVETA